MLLWTTLLFAHAGPETGGPRIPLAYPPGTPAGNIAKFLARTELRAKHQAGPDDGRPVEVASCPDRVDPVTFPQAFAAIRRGFAATNLALKHEAGVTTLAATGPAPEKGPFVLVRPVALDDAAKAKAASLSVVAEPLGDDAFVVIATVDRRAEITQAFCPAAAAK